MLTLCSLLWILVKNMPNITWFICLITPKLYGHYNIRKNRIECKRHTFVQNYPILNLKRAKWSGECRLIEYAILICKIRKSKLNQWPHTNFWQGWWGLSVCTSEIYQIGCRYHWIWSRWEMAKFSMPAQLCTLRDDIKSFGKISIFS